MTKSGHLRLQRIKLGKEPVVVLPMKKWREIEDALEDLEMYTSEKLRKDIATARKEKKIISLERLLKKYRI
jgi:hypothetical protein